MRGWFYGKGRAMVNALLIALMVALYVTTATPVAQSAMAELYQSPVYRGHKKGMVGLACAVSWDAEALPDMLDALSKRDTQITIFVSGDWANENQPLLQRMVADGHEIGTLGQTPGEDGDVNAVVRDVTASIESINAACGVRPVYYNCGMREQRVSTRAAQKIGLTHVVCTVDVLSARGEAADILSRALDQPFDGSILLMQPTREAVKALPACIDGLENMGYRVGTISQAL